MAYWSEKWQRLTNWRHYSVSYCSLIWRLPRRGFRFHFYLVSAQIDQQPSVPGQTTVPGALGTPAEIEPPAGALYAQDRGKRWRSCRSYYAERDLASRDARKARDGEKDTDFSPIHLLKDEARRIAANIGKLPERLHKVD
jgi:hypothetical protein